LTFPELNDSSLLIFEIDGAKWHIHTSSYTSEDFIKKLGFVDGRQNSGIDDN
jgi:hypothetical protein